MNLQRLTGVEPVLTDDIHLINDNKWKFTTEELDTQLRENSLKLIRDGHLLRVV